MVTTSSMAGVERLEAKMVETERKVSTCLLHVEYQQFRDKMMEGMAKYVSYHQYQVMREEIQPLSPLPSEVSIIEEAVDKLGRGMQSCVTLETVNKVINEQTHTLVATFQGNLQVEENQVLQQVGEAKAILAEAKLEVIENQGIMTSQKAINSALEAKAAEVVQQVAEARALATEAKLEVTEVRGIRSQIETSITPPPPTPRLPAPVNDHLAEIKDIKAKYEAEWTEATRSAQVSAGEASTAAKAASRDAAIAADESNMVKETALRVKDYVEEAKRYNAQSNSSVSETRRHRYQVEAMVQVVHGGRREGPVRGQRPPGIVNSTRRRRRGRGTAVRQEHNTRRAPEQWKWRVRAAGETAARLRAQARSHVCRKMSHKPEPKPSQPPAAEVAPPPRAVRGYGGPGLAGVRVEVARMQADAALQPPSSAFSVTSAEVSSPSSPESLETVRLEGPQAAGRQRGEGAAAGTGEGGDKGGQAEASGGRTEGVAAEAEGKGEGKGQRAVGRRRADPFNIADVMAGVDGWRGESVVDDILVGSEDEGEGARRMPVEGGPGQPTAPNVPAPAMKSILPEVRRQEDGKGGRGQQTASAAGSGDSSVRTGGRGRTGKGGKGQVGTSGATHVKGHQEGKGGKGVGKGHQWPQPQHLFKQPPPGSPPQVSAAVRAEEERESRRQQAARYEALAHVEHQRRRHQPPVPGPDTIYRLEMESGRTGSGRQGGLER